MSNLLVAGCRWAPRNFTWSEWNIYLADNLGSYHPICPNALIPRDAIDGIQTEARQQILAGQVLRGTQRLKDLNGWLQVNGQFGSYGVDINAFVSEVSATATAEALLMSILIPTPSVTPSPMQPASPLLSQPPSPLPSPTITPQASGTPVAPSPVVTLGRSITPPLSPP